MRVLNIGAGDLKRLAQTRKIIVFGVGKIFDKTLKRFSQYHLEKDIEYLVDNDPQIWDSEKIINKKHIKVYSPDYMRKHINRKCILVIMVRQYSEIVKQLSEYKELKHIVVYKYPIVYYLKEKRYKQKYIKMPLSNSIISNGEGDNHENALALFEYFRDNGLLGKYKWIWICSHPKGKNSNIYVQYIPRNIYENAPSLKDIYNYERVLYTSKYIFYENLFLYKKRKEQIAIYLKHGTFMLKNVKGKISIPEEVDGAICTSHNYAALAAEQENINISKLIFCGSPRLDFLYKEKQVLETFDLYEKGEKYILWLPTLRQTVGLERNDVNTVAPFGVPLINEEAEFDQMDRKLKGLSVKLIIKPHPHQDLSVYKMGKYRNILFISQSQLDKYEFPIHSLMRECDALVSDYSSIAFDFMLLDRPIAYTIDDMDDYKIGFSVEDPLYYMPGEKLSTVDDMLVFFEHVAAGEDLFVSERRNIRDYVHEYQDDKNCERFLKIMKII